MNNRFFFSFLDKLPIGKKKEEKKHKEINAKKELEECVRKQAEELTEELNFRLMCLQLGEGQQEADRELAMILEKAELYQVWKFLTNTRNVLWVEEVSVIEIICPEIQNPVKQLMDKVMSFITNKNN